MTVDVVHSELRDGVDSRPYLDAALTLLGDAIPVVTPAPAARDVETELLETLDPGEAQALAVAEVATGVVVTDDGDARAVAKRRGVNLTGSIGLLVRFVERGDVSTATADEYLKRWIDGEGFRSPARDFDVFLEE